MKIIHPDTLKGYADDNETFSYKERAIDFKKPVLVYRNLNKKGKWYSIKQFGKVVAHSTALCLHTCDFIVNEKGRQKVLSSKQKSVHAFIKGFYTSSGMGTTAKRNDLPITLIYNPYDKGYFYGTLYPNHPLKGARFVILNKDGIKASYIF